MFSIESKTALFLRLVLVFLRVSRAGQPFFLLDFIVGRLRGSKPRKFVGDLSLDRRVERVFVFLSFPPTSM